MQCHLQIFIDDDWKDCASISQRATGGSHFEYDLDYAFGEVRAAVSLPIPVDANIHTYPHWPAFFYDLIPQGNGRKFLLGQLKLMDGPAADFPLVCAGAFNPIGRVRIAEAVSYFEQHIGRHDAQEMAQGITLEEIIARGEEFHERMMVHSMLAAGTTGVQGAAPKYLLTRDRRNLWHADGALADAEASGHFIVKRPRGPAFADKKVLKNEAAYMRVATAMGIRTHGHLEHHHDALFIPRFDRRVDNGKVIRLHQESVASLAGLIGFDTAPTQFEMLFAIRQFVTDKTGETIEFLKRDILNLAMRNTDNHARNTAVQQDGSIVCLTPLFDFAPMYLDPEGIARAARWYHPVTKRELTEWNDIISALMFDDEEAWKLRNALHAFGDAMNGLTGVLQDAGVDDDIISFLQPSIENQIRQLEALGRG